MKSCWSCLMLLALAWLCISLCTVATGAGQVIQTTGTPTDTPTDTPMPNETAYRLQFRLSDEAGCQDVYIQWPPEEEWTYWTTVCPD